MRLLPFVLLVLCVALTYSTRAVSAQAATSKTAVTRAKCKTTTYLDGVCIKQEENQSFCNGKGMNPYTVDCGRQQLVRHRQQLNKTK